MREIKFRVWDKALDKMVYRHLEKYDTEHPAIEVMQFTGLKDKNGAEIYEGDILSDYTETDEGLVKSFQQVYWCEKKGAWMLDESFKLSGWLLSEELEQFKYEISGNIYENLELIKK